MLKQVYINCVFVSARVSSPSRAIKFSSRPMLRDEWGILPKVVFEKTNKLVSIPF